MQFILRNMHSDLSFHSWAPAGHITIGIKLIENTY